MIGIGNGSSSTSGIGIGVWDRDEGTITAKAIRFLEVWGLDPCLWRSSRRKVPVACVLVCGVVHRQTDRQTARQPGRDQRRLYVSR